MPTTATPTPQPERHPMPPALCPHCSRELTGASAFEGGEGPPQEGDVSICVYCAGVSLWAKGGGLRKPHPREAEQLSRDPQLARMRQAIRFVHERSS